MLAAIPEEFLWASFEGTATGAPFLQDQLRKDLWRSAMTAVTPKVFPVNALAV
jgi:hypothetical protein